MSASTDLRALLVAAPAVAALVGSRVRADRAEQGDDLPFVVYTGTAEPQRTLSGAVADTLHVFELQCWATSRAGAQAVGDAVQAALDGQHQYITARAPGFDESSDLECEILTCSWWDD